MEPLQELERFLLEGDMDALNELLERILTMQDYDKMYDAANILVEYGFLPQADRLFAQLQSVFPEEAQLKIDRATTLLELGEEDEALLLLTSIEPDEEEYVQALLAQADYYQIIGMAETAIAKIKEAGALAPHEPIIQFAHAEMLLEAGRFIEAVRIYLELLERHEELAGVRLRARIAETYSAGAAYEEAIPYYEKLLEEETNPDELFGLAFAYYQTGRFEESLKRLEQLTAMDPDYFSAYMLAGQCHAHLNEDEQALEWFAKGMERDEFDKELRLAAGKSALKLGRPVEAEEHLKQALALDPEYIDALVTLASFYDHQERDDELIELLTYMGAEQLEIPLLYAFLAYAYDRSEQYGQAYEMYRKAYAGMKEDQSFLDQFAKFLLAEGKREEALQVIKELLLVAPEAEDWIAYLEAQFDEEV